MKNLLARAKSVFKNADVDVILLFNSELKDSNFTYLSGFRSGTFEYTPLLVKKNSLTLYPNVLEAGIARKEKPNGMVLKEVGKGEALKKELAKEIGGKTLGINGTFLPFNLYKYISKIKPKPRRIVDVSKAFTLARLVKDEDEISRLRRAVSLTKESIRRTKAEIKTGMTELEVADIFESHLLEMGARTSFSSIVSFDANTALPHHSPGDAKLKSNSIVLFDVGAKHKDYCGDITRTFMFKPDKKSAKYKKFLEIYGVVERAQSAALKSMKSGAPASRPHIIAEKIINSYKDGIYKGKFIHALGHSIGLEVHDGGTIYPGTKLKLKENMIFSDEPGIYIEGFGGVRIEDDVLIGKKSSSFL